MSYDPTGTREFECCPYGDCYYCKAKKLKSKPTSSPVSSNEIEYGFTYSNGISNSFNVGPFSYSVQFGLSIDNHGNIEGQWTSNVGLASTFDIGATVGSYNMYTNAPSVEKQRGMGYQIGAGAAFPIPYTIFNGVAESNLVILPQDNTTYYGYSDYKGISFPKGAGTGFSLHGSGGNTQEVFSFDIFDLFRW